MPVPSHRQRGDDVAVLRHRLRCRSLWVTSAPARAPCAQPCREQPLWELFPGVGNQGLPRGCALTNAAGVDACVWWACSDFHL